MAPAVSGESYYDITFFGITPQYSVGIWCGDPSNASTVPVGTSCADVFSNFLNQVITSSDIQSFPMDNASNPEYKEYTDTKYHIYGNSNPNGSSSSSSSSSDSSSSEGDTGGGTGGGTGGDTGGGDSGGDTGGGDTGGGDTGGGDSGGGEGGVTG